MRERETDGNGATAFAGDSIEEGGIDASDVVNECRWLESQNEGSGGVFNITRRFRSHSRRNESEEMIESSSVPQRCCMKARTNARGAPFSTEIQFIYLLYYVEQDIFLLNLIN